MRIRHLLGTAAAVASALPLAVGPADAITNGSPDGNAHPAVGALVAAQAYSDGTWTYCSGSLISPTVFLTAAHCGEGGGDRVRVTFDSAYQDGDKVYAVPTGPGGHQYLYNDVRMQADGTLDSVNQTWLRISEKTSQGSGGGCY